MNSRAKGINREHKESHVSLHQLSLPLNLYQIYGKIFQLSEFLGFQNCGQGFVTLYHCCATSVKARRERQVQLDVSGGGERCFPL